MKRTPQQAAGFGGQLEPTKAKWLSVFTGYQFAASPMANESNCYPTGLFFLTHGISPCVTMKLSWKSFGGLLVYNSPMETKAQVRRGGYGLIHDPSRLLLFLGR